MRFKILLAISLALAGCASEVRRPVDETAQHSGREWPEAPDTARIRYLYSFSRSSDLGFKRPFLDRVRDSLSGNTEPEFVRPYSIAVADESIAIADPGAGAVHLLNRDKKSFRTISRVDGHTLVSPVGVAVSGERTFIADSFLNLMFILDGDLSLIATVEGLQRPTAMAWSDRRSQLYVAETHAHRLQVYDGDGKHLKTIGERGDGPAQFNFPTHLAVGEDAVYVNDTMNFRVQLLTLEGSFITMFGSHGDARGYFAQPKGVAVDSQGHVYVAESLAGRLQLFDRDGQFLMEFGEQGGGPGGFELPAGLAMHEDRLYVCDSHNGRIQVFHYLREE